MVEASRKLLEEAARGRDLGSAKYGTQLDPNQPVPHWGNHVATAPKSLEKYGGLDASKTPAQTDRPNANLRGVRFQEAEQPKVGTPAKTRRDTVRAQQQQQQQHVDGGKAKKDRDDQKRQQLEQRQQQRNAAKNPRPASSSAQEQQQTKAKRERDEQNRQLLEQRQQQRASTAPKPGTNTYSRGGEPDLSRFAAPSHGKESPEDKAARRAERREANLQAQMSPEKV